MMHSIKPMKILSVFIIASGLMISSCTAGQAERKTPQPIPDATGLELYTTLSDRINSGGDQIDYDTLMQVYQTMINAPCEIAHMDRLLTSLIKKRNSNPRVDQMILILSAKILGQSSFPVPEAYALFESILTKDDRSSLWVLAHTAEAIGDYGEVIPEGDKLADLAQKKVAMFASTTGPRKEVFGSHFLPPPRGGYIRSYINGVQPRSVRESERNHYYLLISAGYAESDIEAALRRLLAGDRPAAGNAGEAYLKYLSQNHDRIHRR